MRGVRAFRLAFVSALLTLLCWAQAQAQEASFFSSGFEVVQPTTDAEAARFLNQGTFGANPTDIATLRAIGYSNWIERQRMIAPGLRRVALQTLAANLNSGSLDRADRIRQWWLHAVTGDDQLRQRMAYALSQIIVISDQGDALSGETLMMAEWNDILLRNAFGNYRTLLMEATRSPMMGRWLTSIRNRKLEGTIAPDENYAREIMQLFSIGLYDRNMDGSPVLVGGQRVPTYDNQTIATVARVFTGLAYGCTAGNAFIDGTLIEMPRICGNGCVGTDCRFVGSGTRTLFTLFFGDPPRDDRTENLIGATVLNRGLRHPDFFRPMVCYPRYNDTGRQSNGQPWVPANNQPTPAKTITISGANLLTLPEIGAGSPTPPNCHATDANISAANRTACLNYCESGVDSLVDTLFNHPNTAPFVAEQLIQRFVTSNPSPAYVRRVACAFAGSTATAADCPGARVGARGDLARTLRAVLLDADARVSYASAPVNFGKPREPMLKMLAVWRSFGAFMPPIANRNGGTTNPESIFGQRPLGAPSVFNFYEPDYQQPGQVSSVNVNGVTVANTEDGLVSPEFKIINEVSIVDTANTMFGVICAGYNNCQNAFQATPPTTPHIPPASLDALPLTSNAQLIEALNVRMMGGMMSGTIAVGGACADTVGAGGVGTGMKGVLYQLVQCSIPATFGATSVDERRRKALYLISLIAISPEYGTQR
jgi:uncharacterized protein (DUF1800 family)